MGETNYGRWKMFFNSSEIKCENFDLHYFMKHICRSAARSGRKPPVSRQGSKESPRKPISRQGSKESPRKPVSRKPSPPPTQVTFLTKIVNVI